MPSDIFLDESCRMFAGASLYVVQVFPCLPSHLTAPSLDSTPPCSWIHVSIYVTTQRSPCNYLEKAFYKILTNPSLYAVQVFPCLPSILITWIERHRAAGYLVQINAQRGFIFAPYNFSRYQHGTLHLIQKKFFKEGLRYSPYNISRAWYWMQEIEIKGWKISTCSLAGTNILHYTCIR